MRTYLEALKAPRERWQARGWKLRRKPGLGQYNASRDEWYKVWRIARLKYDAGMEPGYSNSLECKAFSILLMDRNARSDNLYSSTKNRKR